MHEASCLSSVRIFFVRCLSPVEYDSFLPCVCVFVWQFLFLFLFPWLHSRPSFLSLIKKPGKHLFANSDAVLLSLSFYRGREKRKRVHIPTSLYWTARNKERENGRNSHLSTYCHHSRLPCTSGTVCRIRRGGTAGIQTNDCCGRWVRGVSFFCFVHVCLPCHYFIFLLLGTSVRSCRSVPVDGSHQQYGRRRRQRRRRKWLTPK